MKTATLATNLSLIRLILIFCICLFCLDSKAQLDYVSGIVTLDSPAVSPGDSATFSPKIFNVSLTPDDPADLGSISIVIYNINNPGEAVSEVSRTRDEMLASGWIPGNPVKIKLGQYNPGDHYTLKVYPQNLAGAYAHELILFYSTED